MSLSSNAQRGPSQDPTIKYAKTLHNVALATVIVCPILALLPPRKLDIYTIALGGTTLYSGNYLIQERTGRSIWQHVNGTQNRAVGHNGVTAAVTHTIDRGTLNQAREIIQRTERSNVSTTEELKALQSQREAWKAQREKEIKDDIEEGKGFGDMIVDQVWEVWNWGKKKDDEE